MCHSARFLPDPCRRAFTLIELLIVVSVIGLLASLSLSAISLVRETANSTRCAANFRQIGIVMTTFTQDNSNRYPSGAIEQVGSIIRSQNWQDILNQEVLQGEAQTERMGAKKSYSSLSCPSYRHPPGGTPYRSYGMNRDALGGPSDAYGNLPYGREITPATSKKQTYLSYHLGALAVRFQRPTEKVLIQEDEQPRDTVWYSGGAYAGIFVYTPSATLSRFAVNDGGFAFRHNNGENALFMDLHTQRFGMADTAINQASSYALVEP
jgi:prepilin-type N-terminal cleavage/methylation domain-containing protein